MLISFRKRHKFLDGVLNRIDWRRRASGLRPIGLAHMPINLRIEVDHNVTTRHSASTLVLSRVSVDVWKHTCVLNDTCADTTLVVMT